MVKKSLKKVGFVLGCIFLLSILYAMYDHEMIKLKYGYTAPLMLDRDQFSEVPVRIDMGPRKIEEVHVSITDLYYLPKSHQIFFGLWYKKWQHRSNDFHNVFDVTLEDQDGRKYNYQSYAKMSGLLDRFQYRAVSYIDLSKIKKLYIIISIPEKNGDKVIVNNTKKIEVPIDGLGSLNP